MTLRVTTVLTSTAVHHSTQSTRDCSYTERVILSAVASTQGWLLLVSACTTPACRLVADTLFYLLLTDYGRSFMSTVGQLSATVLNVCIRLCVHVFVCKYVCACRHMFRNYVVCMRKLTVNGRFRYDVFQNLYQNSNDWCLLGVVTKHRFIWPAYCCVWKKVAVFQQIQCCTSRAFF